MTAAAIRESQAQKIERWVVDPARSTVEFTVRHAWGLSAVRGRFHRFGGWYVVKEGGSALELSIDPESIDTGNAKRDEHLRTDDFFDVQQHPRIRFASTAVVEDGDGELHVTGELDVAGARIPLALDASTRSCGEEVEIEASTSVDHRDFGMSSGPLWSIRPPVAVHVKARLAPSTGLFG